MSSSSCGTSTTRQLVERLLQQTGIPDVGSGVRIRTKAGWCLREGLETIGSSFVQNNNKTEGRHTTVVELIERHGVPGFYSCLKKSKQARHDATQDLKDPSTSFESLCRIIVGQFVSGSSAQAAWKRLVTTMEEGDHPRTTQNQVLTPSRILTRVQEQGLESGLQKPAGLTKAKAASIVDLATHFHEGKLSEELLESPLSSEEEIRKSLLSVRGIGPWSCDIFLMFTLERSNILPLGDLGVRKGILKHFGVCPQKHPDRVHELLRPFEPYLSLVTYYMWRVVDTDSTSRTAKAKASAPLSADVVGTPSKKRRLAREVTP